MSSHKQQTAAKENLKKARDVWQNMYPEERSRAQPKGRERTKPGLGKEGEYYHITVRDKNQFILFRTHDVGEKGHTLRVAGKRARGSWATQKWLISKEDAHVENGILIADRTKTQQVLKRLGSKPKLVKGDLFQASPRKKIPQKNKPTEAQIEARKANIQKAQRAKKKQVP